MVLEKVAAALADKTGLDVSAITADKTFEDLKLDSLDTVDVLMSLEDEFGVSLEVSEDMKCVGDIVRYIEQGGTAQ
jgi:Acyl carrier protein